MLSNVFKFPTRLLIVKALVLLEEFMSGVSTAEIVPLVQPYELKLSKIKESLNESGYTFLTLHLKAMGANLLEEHRASEGYFCNTIIWHKTGGQHRLDIQIVKNCDGLWESQFSCDLCRR